MLPASNIQPTTVKMPCTKPGTASGWNHIPWPKRDSKIRPGIKWNADSASQSMPTSRTCPAIRLSMGINGVTPAALPQIGQNFAGSESLAPQRSQNILMPRRHLVYPAWRNDRCLSSAHHARTRQATKNDGRPTGNLLYLGYGGGQGFVPEMLTCSPSPRN